MSANFELDLVQIENPDELNFILGQSHFIKTVEDIHELMVTTVPGVKFGLAFCEASGAVLVRSAGNDEDLKHLAEKNALAIGAGHSFILFMREAFPINVLNGIKMVPEVARVFCASANPVQVMVATSSQGKGILGVIDGQSASAVEGSEDVAWRKSFLRKIGYKVE